MPLITVKLCPRCGKKTCNGEVWRIVKVEEDGNLIDWGELNSLNCSHQAFGGGSATKKLKVPTGLPIGIKIERYYPNWVRPAIVTYEKVED